MKRLLTILTLIILTACWTTTENKNEQIDNQETIEISAIEETERIIGERIDGPANVRDTINGKVLLSLNDNIIVETAPKKGNWYQIGVYVKLTAKQNEEFKIYPNTDLYSIDGAIIGKSKDTIELWMSDDVAGFFGAYTHSDNIKRHTIPERALESEIDKKHLTLSTLKNFIWSFDFQDYGENTELKYKQLYIYESTVVDHSPRDRITLLFDTKENLIGVIHSRELNLSKYKTYELVRGHSLTVIADIDNKELKRIKDERINFYNSVD